MKTPPGFGHGRPWPMCVLQWTCNESPDSELRECSVMILNGMPVHEQLREFYWKEHVTFGDMLKVFCEIGHTPTSYLLVRKRDGQIRGYGALPGNVSAHDLAWISCMFCELGEYQITLLCPDDIDPKLLTKVRGGKILEMHHVH